MNRNKIACNCRNITYGKIEDAIREGFTTLEEVIDRTGAGKSCGECVEILAYLVRDIKEEISNEVVMTDGPDMAYNPDTPKTLFGEPQSMSSFMAMMQNQVNTNAQEVKVTSDNTCANCKSEVSANDKFCSGCGMRLIRE